MEDTLGKRISANRKGLGLTQEQLAEQLGVTAQAVSKWENDQSCPDITMLPKLAQIFSTTTDELLGLEPPKVHTIERITQQEEAEPEGIHIDNGTGWEFRWDNGRKGTLMLAVWVFLSGMILLLQEARIFGTGFYSDFWDILWPTGLLVFGIFGIFPKFSLFRLGCAMVGGYFLLAFLHIIPYHFGKSALLPVFLMLFGLKLMSDAAKRPKHGTFQIAHDGKVHGGPDANYCHFDGERFSCAASFGEHTHRIPLARLSGGEARVNFGEMTLDLTACEELADGAAVDLHCAFGELEVLVPRNWRVVSASSTRFAAVDTRGTPGAEADKVLHLNCSASFGEISIRYV